MRERPCVRACNAEKNCCERIKTRRQLWSDFSQLQTNFHDQNFLFFQTFFLQFAISNQPGLASVKNRKRNWASYQEIRKMKLNFMQKIILWNLSSYLYIAPKLGSNARRPPIAFSHVANVGYSPSPAPLYTGLEPSCNMLCGSNQPAALKANPCYLGRTHCSHNQSLEIT